MGNEWKEIKLGELVKPKGGKRLPKGTSLQTAPNKHPYIRVRDMGGRDLPRMGLEFVPDSVFPSIKRYIVEKNDVIISIVGTVGLVSIIDDFYHLASQTENCAKLSGFDSEDAQYIYYYLISNFGQEEIRRNTVGAVQPKLPLYGIEDISIFWPEKIHRLAIGNYFFSIDNKIQLNRQTNQTLEAMAQALFKSWFVDFDPVFDNVIAHNLAHNKDPLHNIPEPLLPHAKRRLNAHNVGRGSARQTAAHAFHHLFPQAFEQSDEPSVGIQGWIPKGWEASSLEKLAEKITDGSHQSPPSVDSNEGMPMASSKDLTTNGIELDSCRYISKQDFSALVGNGCAPVVGDILVAKDGARCGETCCIHNSEIEVVLLSSVAIIRPKSSNLGVYINTLLARKETISELRENYVSGSAIPRIVLKDFKRFPVVKATPEILNLWSQQTDLWQERRSLLSKEIKSLTQLRDTLLPKLISGELRIPDAQQSVAALVK